LSDHRMLRWVGVAPTLDGLPLQKNNC